MPQRALVALKNFRDLIEDARAMLAGTYAKRLEKSSTEVTWEQPPSAVQRGEAPQLPDTATMGGDAQIAFDPAEFNFGAAEEDQPSAAAGEGARPTPEAFRTPGSAANTAELLKFLIDRTGYIKQLEEEDTPEAYSRVENLHELVNAAMDSRDRGETLDQFLDHAALVSDADAYDERAQITLMTLHAAKGLEFPLVFLCGLEEGLFPHSRTFLHPDDIEEERRLCYVGMTRAMSTLVLTRAVYRRRYGTDLPEASVPSRFLEEVPAELMEDLGGGRNARRNHVGTAALGRPAERSSAGLTADTHYAYEDEDQSAAWIAPARQASNPASSQVQLHRQHRRVFRLARQAIHPPQSAGRAAVRARKDSAPASASATRNTARERSISAKATVKKPRLRYNSPRFGLKKLVEKYAQLERA